jgi:hypothetical protein
VIAWRQEDLLFIPVAEVINYAVETTFTTHSPNNGEWTGAEVFDISSHGDRDCDWISNEPLSNASAEN